MAASGFAFRLTGQRELDRKFAALEPKVRKKVVRPAVRAAAKLIHEDAKSRLPKDTGAYKKSLKVRAGKRTRKRKNEVRVVVITEQGFFKGETFYGGFQEFGWRVGSRKLGDNRKQIKGRHDIEKAYKAKGPAAKELAQRMIRKGIEAEAKTGGGA